MVGEPLEQSPDDVYWFSVQELDVVAEAHTALKDTAPAGPAAQLLELVVEALVGVPEQVPVPR